MDLQRDGLIEALLDAGVDMNFEGLDVPRQAALTLALGDLSLNYRAATRAIAITKLQIPAGGAATYGGALIYAPPTGFWCRHLGLASGATAVWSVISPTLAATYAGWALNVSWNAWGDESGQVINNSTLTAAAGLANPFMSRSSLYGTADPTVPISPGAIDIIGGGSTPTLVPFPLWVPGNMCLYIQNAAANAGMNLNIAIQFTAQNPGRFP